MEDYTVKSNKDVPYYVVKSTRVPTDIFMWGIENQGGNRWEVTSGPHFTAINAKVVIDISAYVDMLVLAQTVGFSEKDDEPEVDAENTKAVQKVCHDLQALGELNGGHGKQLLKGLLQIFLDHIMNTGGTKHTKVLDILYGYAIAHGF